MRIHISTRDGAPIYRQIVRQVTALVASGRLAPGEQLPPVRRLAEELIINPNTVARAYRELESTGLLVTRPGSGVFVDEAAAPSPADLQRQQALTEQASRLLEEARRAGVDVDALIDLLRERARELY